MLLVLQYSSPFLLFSYLLDTKRRNLHFLFLISYFLCFVHIYVAIYYCRAVIIRHFNINFKKIANYIKLLITIHITVYAISVLYSRERKSICTIYCYLYICYLLFLILTLHYNFNNFMDIQ